MSAAADTLGQFRWENKSFWRNPAAAFFVFVFPLMFLFIFNGLGVGSSQFYVPAMATFSIITACYTNVAMNVTITRDEGVLKRLRGTPLPPTAFLVGKVIHATFLAVILLLIVCVSGTLFFDVDLPADSIPLLVAWVLVGAASFSALGLAFTSLIPNADAAPAMVNFSILPLLFISGVFIDTRNAPEWLSRISDIFPVAHFNETILHVFNPNLIEFERIDLVIVALWGIAGLLLAARFFSWEPRR